MSEDSIIDLINNHQGGPPTDDSTSNQGSRPPMSEADTGSVKRKVEQMQSNIPKDAKMDATLSKLLEKIGPKFGRLAVELPSDGLFYKDSVNKVSIRPFTFEDERLLKTMDFMQQDAGDRVLEQLLRNCVDGIDPSELTPLDRLYLLFRLRGISYGDDYPMGADCTHCRERSELGLKISTLKITKLTKEMLVFIAPDSEVEIEVKLPRTQDNHLISNADKMIENMHMFVRSVGGVTDSTIIQEFIRRTTVRDIDTIRRSIYTPEYGMEDHFFYNCAGCGGKNRVNITLNEHFFTAS
jgi:hypothetical protein